MNRSIWWIVGFSVVGVLLLAGVLLLVTSPPRGEPIVLVPAPTPAPIMIYVSGSVQNPGLYALPVGSRVNDAIEAAGGFSIVADGSGINLAQLLADGEQVNVPEVQPTAAGGNETRPAPGISMPVDINAASLEQLDSLPEIGPMTAQKIIDYRAAHGRFTRVEDLLAIDGIGQVTFDKIKSYITVGTSP